jgi:hypothetical protein
MAMAATVGSHVMGGRDARDRQRLRADREVVDEQDQVDEVARPGVLDIPRQGQGMELLGEVLIDWIDGEP